MATMLLPLVTVVREVVAAAGRGGCVDSIEAATAEGGTVEAVHRITRKGLNTSPKNTSGTKRGVTATVAIRSSSAATANAAATRKSMVETAEGVFPLC